MAGFDDLPNEIIINILLNLANSPSTLLNLCCVSHVLSDVASFHKIWAHSYKIKWGAKDKEIETKIEEKEKEVNEETTQDTEQTIEKDIDKDEKDWKLLFKQRMKEEIQQALQKASVEALRYQAKIALLQSKKREYDFFLQVLSNKRAKIETSEPEKKEPVPVGWHPAFVQEHFEEQAKKRFFSSFSQPLNIDPEHAKSLKNRYEATERSRAMSEQVRMKIKELSDETEMKKRSLREELKKFGS